MGPPALLVGDPQDIVLVVIVCGKYFVVNGKVINKKMLFSTDTRPAELDQLIINNLRQLWLSQKLCDVRLNTKDHKVLHAHSCVLTSRCVLFKDILLQIGQSDVLPYEIGLDQPYEVVQNVLRFLYFHQLDVSGFEQEMVTQINNLIETLQVGKVWFENENLTDENAVQPTADILPTTAAGVQFNVDEEVPLCTSSSVEDRLSDEMVVKVEGDVGDVAMVEDADAMGSTEEDITALRQENITAALEQTTPNPENYQEKSKFKPDTTLVQDIVPSVEMAPAARTDPVAETGPDKQTSSLEQINHIEITNLEQQTALAQETDSVQETESIQGADCLQVTDSVQSTTSVQPTTFIQDNVPVAVQNPDGTISYLIYEQPTVQQNNGLGFTLEDLANATVIAGPVPEAKDAVEPGLVLPMLLEDGAQLVEVKPEDQQHHGMEITDYEPENCVVGLQFFTNRTQTRTRSSYKRPEVLYKSTKKENIQESQNTSANDNIDNIFPANNQLPRSDSDTKQYDTLEIMNVSQSKESAQSGSFLCTLCNTYFKEKRPLTRHYLRHFDIRHYGCSVCPSKFLTKKETISHMKIHDSRFCQVCLQVVTEGKHNCKIEHLDALRKIMKEILDFTDQGIAENKIEIVSEVKNSAVKIENDVENENSMVKKQCHICLKFFCDTASLNRHLLRHNKDKPFNCDMCEKCFGLKQDLHKHLSGMHKVPFCKKCLQTFKQATELSAHMCSVEKLEAVRKINSQALALFKDNADVEETLVKCRCKLCGKFFTSKTEKDQHVNEEHHGKYSHNFECSVCNYQSEKKNNVKRHMRAKHDVDFCELCLKVICNGDECSCTPKSTTKKTQNASLCEADDLEPNSETPIDIADDNDLEPQRPPSAKRLRIDHEQTEVYAKENQNTETNELGVSVETLKLENESVQSDSKDARNDNESAPEHGDTDDNMDQKFLHCTECSEKFENNSSLKLHMRDAHGRDFNIVDPENKLLCNICGKDFRLRHNLKRHLQRHEGKKSFQCNVCHKKFIFLQQLKDHMVKHSTAEPHLCNQCGTTFKTKRYLTIHIKNRHEEVGTFPCGHCDAVFEHKISLTNHLKKHAEPTLKCNYCDQMFSSTTTRRYHEAYHFEDSDLLMKCEKCEFVTHKKSLLDNHCIKHTNEKKYQCQYCFKKYKHPYIERFHKCKLGPNKSPKWMI